MAGGHPVDALGRVLPHPAWPADRQAPGALELVRRFCNSINRENGAERFLTPAGFDGWLTDEGRQAVHPTADELTRIIGVREAVHDLVVANATGATAPAAWDRLTGLLAPATLVFAPGEHGLDVVAVGDGVDGWLAELGLTIVAAVDDGTWPRLKACRNCHWVVFDPSKNRSARWCSMSACGGRHNAREYRRRRSVG